MTKTLKYDIVQLNNKSRQGTYLYIKQTGLPSRYYKYTGETVELEALVNYYKDRFVTKKVKGSSTAYKKAYKERITEKSIPLNKQTPIHKQAQRYVKQIKKKGSINKLIGKGITESKITDIFRAGQKTLKEAKTNLIKDLVLDASLIEVMINEENMKKMKFRMEHRIEIKDKYGETIIQAKKFNITLDKLQREIKKIITIGEGVQADEQYGGASQKLKNAGYNVSEGTKNGIIHSISVHTIFRKGK